MTSFSRLLFAAGAATILAAQPAAAVPLGSGTMSIDLQGTVTDNVTCLISTFDNATYDVFDTDVNLGTEMGYMVCTDEQGE